MVKNVQGAIDQHVAPHFEKVKQTTQEAIQQHVAPHFDKAKDTTSRAINGLGESTKNLHETHIAPHVENMKQSSARAVQEISTKTKEAMDQHVAPHVENIKVETGKAMDVVKQGTVSNVILVKSYKDYYWGTAPSLHFDQPLWKLIIEGSFRAIGQVISSNNPISGIMIWVAMMISSPVGAVASLLGVFTVNILTRALELDKESMTTGLYAFNAAILGVAIETYLNLSWWKTVLLTVFASPIALLVYQFMAKRSWRPLLFPYNIVMILLLLGTGTTTQENDGSVISHGVMQVYLSSGIASGSLILVALLLYSRILTASVAVAYIVTGFLGDTANMSLVVAYMMVHAVPSVKMLVTTVLALPLSFLVQAATEHVFGYVSLPSLTLPYCFVIMLLDLEMVDEVSTPEANMQKYAIVSEAVQENVEEPRKVGLVTEATPLLDEGTLMV
jgi:urea transporter